MQKVSYMGNGSTTEFNFNFPFYTNSDIIVLKNNQITSDYSIIGTSAGLNADIPYTGGKVVFEIAPLATDSITISRHLPLTRVVDYQPTEKINPTNLNQDLNYMLEVLKDMQDELDTFNTQYNDIVNKESIQNVLSKISHIDGLIDNGEIMQRREFLSYTTNCITKIPQNIKFELNNGTLTLKAGSKIHIPNGVGVFNSVITESDLTVTRTDSVKCMVVYNLSSNNLSVLPMSLFYSGPTAPTAYQFMIWYDTTENKIKFTNNTGTIWVDGRSLPLCIVSTDGSKISAIDQIFNGFGFIGSTIFILPNTKGLVPNGRNTDGTFKTTSVTTSSVITRTGMGTNVSNYQAGLNTGYFINYSSNYTVGNDGFLHIPNGTVYNDVVFATYSTGADGRITAFSSKSVFDIVDDNDFEN